VSDDQKQLLSALIDDEASEIEVHRLLREYQNDDGVRTAFVNFQQVKAVVRGDRLFSLTQHLELHTRIAAEIESDDTLFDAPAQRVPARRFARPAAGLAIAASLVVAVFVGFNLQNGDMEPGSQTPAFSAANPGLQVQPAANAATSNQNGFGVTESLASQTELKELDEDKQRQLRAYLNRHNQLGRMNPNVRTVIFENADSK
jgi:sigma-E factor negative regulatory protein RseA